jgi:hypothetical protein
MSNGRTIVEVRRSSDAPEAPSGGRWLGALAALLFTGSPVEPVYDEPFVVRIKDLEGNQVESLSVRSWRQARKAQAAILRVSADLSDQELADYNSNQRWHSVIE